MCSHEFKFMHVHMQLSMAAAVELETIQIVMLWQFINKEMKYSGSGALI